MLTRRAKAYSSSRSVV